MRVAIALRGANRQDQEVESYIQPMLNVAYSFESGLDRIPFFNDCGNNVAKSLNALLSTAEHTFRIVPVFMSSLKKSGFYIFEKNMNAHKWKLIVDAGQPGPTYIPGHAHCDSMSFELFCDGKPVLVNSGTYAYQCKERSYFRNTASHNTVMIEGAEQSQCWGTFRLANRSETKVIDTNPDSITMEMKDYTKHVIKRTVSICENRLMLCDSSHNRICVFLHLHPFVSTLEIESNASIRRSSTSLYSQEYGIIEEKQTIMLESDGSIETSVKLDTLVLEQK